MKKIFKLSLLVLIITMSSCSPEFINEDPETAIVDQEITTMKNLVVSKDFDWKTYNNVKITMTGNSNDIIEVVSSNGAVYQKAYLAKDQTYEMKLAIPTHEQSVRLLYNNQDVPIDISSGNANYVFE